MFPKRINMLRFTLKSERMLAIAATAVLGGSVASALVIMNARDDDLRWKFPTTEISHNTRSSYNVPPMLAPTKLSCAASNQHTPWPMDVSPDYYLELVPIPDRAKESSHVIFGLLLAKDRLEKYDVYKVIGDSEEVILANISLGKNLDGHTGVVHGGILALLLDDLMGFAFHVMGINMAYTANLNIDYRNSVMANTQVVVRIKCEKREGRKIYFVAQMTSPDSSILYCEATSLYIIPRKQPSVLGMLKRFVGL